MSDKIIVNIEGQKIPVDLDRCKTDKALKDALSPFYPAVTNAKITRHEKDGVLTSIDVVKQAGTKGAIEPRKHFSRNDETGKTIVVIEDSSLEENHVRIECHKKNVDFANAVKQIMRGDLKVTVKPCLFSSVQMHFVVRPSDFDYVVSLMEDNSVTPVSDTEFARELIRSTRSSN